MVEELVPPPAVAVEAYQDDAAADLFPAEEAVIATAVEQARREFATVRRCARAALARLGIAPVPILPGARGAPGWPRGIVGSMTHCAGYRAAVVARSALVRAIGIDAEPNQPLPAGVLDQVSTPTERRWLAALATSRPEVCWDRLLFSAKESVYKAWFPLTGGWLGLQDAELTVDARQRSFHARLLVDGTTVAFHGRWTVQSGLVGTAIVLAA